MKKCKGRKKKNCDGCGCHKSEDEKLRVKVKSKEDGKRTCRKNREDNQATVSLSVGVGSFSDLDECLGLAHFCEHMSLIASKEFPTPGGLESFLATHGGIINGTTFGDTTSFYFVVNYEEDVLEKALDMFSNLFISPTMPIKQIRKEQQMIESEFQEKKGVDLERRIQILQGAGKHGHPVSRFSWGNMSTLCARGRSNESLKKLVSEFQLKHYSAEHMVLAIEAPEPLELIEEWVLEYFSPIPNNGIPRPSLLGQPLPYDTEEFRQFYDVAANFETDIVYLTWELPAEAWKNYKSKPLHYISRVLNSKSTGSLGCDLSRKSMILNIEATEGSTVHEKTECSILFSIKLQLTRIGIDNLFQVLELTFSYIKFLQETDPDENYFRELQNLRAIDFHFHDTEVQDLEKAMRNYPPEDVIIGDYLPTDWDPQSIKKCLDLLIPSKVNIMICQDPIFPERNRIEPYFGTEYYNMRINPTALERFNNVKILPNFKRILPNEYIQTNFCRVLLPEGKDMKIPSRIFHNDKLDFWHFIGNEGTSIFYYLSFLSDVGNYSIQGAVMVEVFAAIVTHSVQEYLFGAVDADSEYCIQGTMTGITIHLNGYSQNTDKIVEYIVEQMFAEHINSDYFMTAKDYLAAIYRLDYTNPDLLNKHLRHRICKEKEWMPIEKYEQLNSLKFHTYKAFALEFLKRFQVIVLAQGNISYRKALKFAKDLSRRFTFKPPRSGATFTHVMRTLPLGESILRVRNMDKTSSTSFISNYYQVTGRDKIDSYLCNYFVSVMREPAYQQLREIDKIGYFVDVQMKTHLGSYGILFVTNTQTFTGNKVKRLINKFIQKFYEENVKNLTLQKLRKSLHGMAYQTNGDPMLNWDEIMNRSYKFLEGEEQEQLENKLKASTVKKWFEKYLLPKNYAQNSSCDSDQEELESSEMRMLSIQVVGSADQEYKEEIIHHINSNGRENLSEKMRERMRKLKKPLDFGTTLNNPLKLLVPSKNCSRKNQSWKNCIQNIDDFISKLDGCPTPVGVQFWLTKED